MKIKIGINTYKFVRIKHNIKSAITLKKAKKKAPIYYIGINKYKYYCLCKYLNINLVN